ncbi:MAG: MopE-related protein [Polyangia bacterium]
MYEMFRYSALIAVASVVWAWSGCESGGGTDIDIGDDTSADADADSDTDMDVDSDTDADTDSDTDADSDTDTDADSDADTDTDTDADSDSDSDADGDTDLPDCVDQDSDWWCAPLDCDDDDPDVHPGAEEIPGDGIDNDCDGQTDEASQQDLDLDGDGWTPAEGDCMDVGDDAELVNPDAVEVPDDGVDNDCDGQTDETETCDCPSVGTGAWDYVSAIGLCNTNFVDSVELYYTSTSGEQGFDTIPSQGSNNCLVAQEGCEMAAISSGPVGQDSPDPGQSMGGPESINFDPQPDYMGTLPTTTPTYESCDRCDIILNLTAPSNALGFSFDFLFASAEYPEWIGDGYNDAFYAIMEYSELNGGATTNISFDSSNMEIEVDNNFFENSQFPCDESGSGWAPADDAGSTGWLRTTWNVDPGDSFQLTFSIHDEGDCIYDSIAFIDNWQWLAEEVDPGTHPVE